MARKGPPRERISLLAALPLFEGSTTRELAEVDALLDDIHVPAGRVLVHEGDAGREIFIIVTGSADVTLRGHHLATLTDGDVFGEMSLIDNQPRAATVTAATEMHLLVAGPSAIAALLSHGGVPAMLLSQMAERIRALEASYVVGADEG